MAERSPRRLDRLLRVRTLQLGMVRADEVRAVGRLADERALEARIRQLADSVAPTPTPAPGSATSLIAAAHYRERLNESAATARARADVAERGLELARAATVAAKRDQGAIEKLIDASEAAAAIRALRTLEAMPSIPRKNRHDPC